MFRTFLSKKKWVILGFFLTLTLGVQAQDDISPKRMMELNQDLKAMKKLMSDTVVKAEGNAMSLIYFWVSQQEKRMDSIKTETIILNTEIEKLTQQPPKDTTAVSKAYLMLDSMRTVEKSFAPPAN